MRIKDKEVIAAIKEGRDDKVLNEIYQNILPKVTSFIRNNNGSEDEAFDVFQDAVMAFYKMVVTGKFDEKYEISGFIYTVSRNLWVNRVKKLNKQISVNTEGSKELEDVNFLESVYDEEKRSLVRILFNQLELKCKEILTYTIYQSMTMEDVCGRMGFASENAAKTSNYRCKKKLMELVKNSSLYKELED